MKTTEAPKVPDAADFGPGNLPTADQLAAMVNHDRLTRRHGGDVGVPWPAYATWIGVKMSTIYKIAKGNVQRPHERTVMAILQKLQEPQAGTSEVVPE